MKKAILHTLLYTFSVLGVLLSGIQAQDEAKSEKACDLKNIQSFPYCGKESNRMLKGFKCPKCEKGKCDWYQKENDAYKRIAVPLKESSFASPEKKEEMATFERALDEHTRVECYFEINKFISNGCKCPCCGATVKDLIEMDFVNKNKCMYCKLDSIGRKEYCVKWIYGCSESHKGILDPAAYNNRCPEEVKDDKGKIKPCGKKLEKAEIDIAEILLKYSCPKCKEVFEIPGKCQACKRNLVKIKVCAKSGKFPHVDEKEYKKEQKKK